MLVASDPSQLVDGLTAERLAQCLQDVLQDSNGSITLNFHSEAGTVASVYAVSGRLVGITSGAHRWRRWLRLTQQYCPKLNTQSLSLPAATQALPWESRVLGLLVQQQQLNPLVAALIVEALITEGVFDLLQAGSEVCEIAQITSQETYNELVLLQEREVTLVHRATQQWLAWKQAGLMTYSPDLTPIIRRPQDLQRLASPQVYQTLTSLLTGQRTFRDLAALTNQDAKLLCQTLVPYATQGLIEMQTIPDLPSLELSAQEPPQVAATPSNSVQRPLVMCIDDNPKVCEMMGKILQAAGYRYISVLDSLEAIPMLLEHKPDLIFLDLVMPVASGYEVCSQIRKIGAFKEVPVVILTGNDGIIDRIRSKASGATDFIAKPPDVSKVLGIVRRYLSVSR